MASVSPPVDREDPQPYPFGPNERLDLHPVYRQIQEHKPLCRVRLPYGEPAWLVTRYGDVVAGLGGPRFSPGGGAPRQRDRRSPRTPPCRPGGIMAPTIAHSASVRSLG